MEIDSGNTAWMLTASALVLFMTPGLGFFYGGLTRNKNVLGTIMQSFITTGVVAVIWVTVGYSLAFGPDQCLGLIGNFDFIGLKDVGAPDVHGLPVDVRHHHAGAHHRRFR
jgi:Amt family ammonium transporter